jgi:hypothetical protein
MLTRTISITINTIIKRDTRLQIFIFYQGNQSDWETTIFSRFYRLGFSPNIIPIRSIKMWNIIIVFLASFIIVGSIAYIVYTFNDQDVEDDSENGEEHFGIPTRT